MQGPSTDVQGFPEYCASAMHTVMTRKMIRASRGTAPTRQRRHGSGDTNAYAMFCSAGHGDAQPKASPRWIATGIRFLWRAVGGHLRLNLSGI